MSMGVVMSFSAGQTGATVSPVHIPDLRPVADASAVRRQAEPVMPVAGPPAMNFPPVSPPSAVAQGVVGRSMLAAVSLTEGGPEGGDERRLKPWGVAMLPHERPEERPAPPEAGKTAEADTRAEASTRAGIDARAGAGAVAGIAPGSGARADAKDADETAAGASVRAPGREEQADRREARPVPTGRPEYVEPPRTEAPRPDGLRPDGQRAEELRAERRSQERESVPTTAMAERRG